MGDNEIWKEESAVFVFERNDYFFDGSDQLAKNVKVDEDRFVVEEWL